MQRFLFVVRRFVYTVCAFAFNAKHYCPYSWFRCTMPFFFGCLICAPLVGRMVLVLVVRFRTCISRAPWTSLPGQTWHADSAAAWRWLLPAVAYNYSLRAAAAFRCRILHCRPCHYPFLPGVSARLVIPYAFACYSLCVMCCSFLLAGRGGLVDAGSPCRHSTAPRRTPC